MSEIYPTAESSHAASDASIPSMGHVQQDYNSHQQKPQHGQEDHQQQHAIQQNNYAAQYHQVPQQHPHQQQYIIYPNQGQQQVHYQVLPQQQQQQHQPMVQQQQQRMIMQPQHYSPPVVVQQPHIMAQQQQQQQIHQVQQQQQAMQQQVQPRQVVVHHQYQQHHPQHQQHHQMVPTHVQPQHHYIMVPQQQHISVQQRPPGTHIINDSGSIRRAIPVRFQRPPNQQQYPQQQILYQQPPPSQQQQSLGQPHPQQRDQQQQQIQDQPIQIANLTHQPKILVIRGANSPLRLAKSNVQLIRSPSIPQQPRALIQPSTATAQTQVRPQVRHPVVQHQPPVAAQPTRLQLVTQRPQVPPVNNPQHWIAPQSQTLLQRPRVVAYPQQHQQPVPQQQQVATGSFQQVQRMRPPQPHLQQPQVPPQPLMNEIQYNVEHVFNENGREVRKMPIKLDNETIWVDCVDQVVAEHQDSGGLVLDLMDEPLTPSAIDKEQLGPSGVTVNRNLHSNHTTMKAKDVPPEEREKIVHEVVTEQISPALLAEKYGIGVAQIRAWVKNAGHKLPSRYKATKMKEIKPTSQGMEVPLLQGQPCIIQGVAQLKPPPPQGQILQPGQQQQPVLQTMMLDSQNKMVPVNSGVGQAAGNSLLQQQQLNQSAPAQMGRQVHLGENTNVTNQQMAAKPVGPQADSANAATGVDQIKKASGPPPIQAVQYKPKLIPGKLAVCKNCGCMSPDFNRCSRCKKPIAEDCKTVNDQTYKVDDAKGGNKTDLRTVRIQHKPRKKNTPDEPECIALSSDEDDSNDADDKKDQDGSEDVQNGEESKTATVEGLEPAASDDRESKVAEEIKQLLSGEAQGLYTTLTARSIRVGSYKSFCKEKIVFADKAIQITVPHIIQSMSVATLTILKSDILKIQAHFGRAIPALFVFASPSCCAKIRTMLKMNKMTGLWLELSNADESMKRITILPERINDDTKSILMKLYGGLVEEVDNHFANDVLVKSSPKDSKLRMLNAQQLTTLPGAAMTSMRKPGEGLVPFNEKYCQFPPTGSPSISVHTNDYFLLDDETFLNDVIIDFFLSWLQFDRLSEKDRDRTHIFSTYFYNRLTKRPAIQKNKLHPVEDDVNLSAAQKRYARVKRWTKSVNIFDKDFVVVPINEHSHWFVAVICFPGLVGCKNIETDEPCEVPDRQSQAIQVTTEKSLRINARKKEMGDKKVMQIGSTSIIPLKPGGNTSFLDKMSLLDEVSDRDEASAEEDDLVDEEEVFPSFQKTLMKIRMAEGSNGANSPADAAAKSESSTAANSPKPAEPKVDESGESKPEETKTDNENGEPLVNGELGKADTNDVSCSGDQDKAMFKNSKSDCEGNQVTATTGNEVSKEPVNSIKTENSGQVSIPAETDPSSSTVADKREDPTAIPVSDAADIKTEPVDEDQTNIKTESAEVKTEIKEEADVKEKKPIRIKQPCILIFDSLQSCSRAKVAATLRDYLACEYQEKVGKERVFTKETMRGCCPKVPQQPNFSDCGIFVLQYIQSFFENPITDFCVPIMNLRRWFTNDVVKNKRSEIAKLIRDLAEKQNPNKKFDFPELQPPPEFGSGYTDDEDNDDNEPGSFAAVKRNTQMVKVGFGQKTSTPTKLPPGIIMTAVPASSLTSATPTRLVCVPTTSGVTSNITPKAGGVVIIKKGNKIDLVHGTATTGKKQKLIIPKVLKQTKTAASSVVNKAVAATASVKATSENSNVPTTQNPDTSNCDNVQNENPAKTPETAEMSLCSSMSLIEDDTSMHALANDVTSQESVCQNETSMTMSSSSEVEEVVLEASRPTLVVLETIDERCSDVTTTYVDATRTSQETSAENVSEGEASVASEVPLDNDADNVTSGSKRALDDEQFVDENDDVDVCGAKKLKLDS